MKIFTQAVCGLKLLTHLKPGGRGQLVQLLSDLVLVTTLHKFRVVFGMHKTAIFAITWPIVHFERYDLLEKQVWAHGKTICLRELFLDDY